MTHIRLFKKAYSDLYLELVKNRPELLGWIYNSLDRPWRFEKRRLALELTATVKDIMKKNIPSDYQWPGNVRELEKCIRRILLQHNYTVEGPGSTPPDIADQLSEGMQEGTVNAQELLSGYCRILYDKYGT